ncbi:hypothetical protein LSAT2_022142 [Lamellibrachia satsuma]|nr:hypothetical protein LSAT2_022142 [Lamellibrachia satsuma]
MQRLLVYLPKDTGKSSQPEAEIKSSRDLEVRLILLSQYQHCWCWLHPRCVKSSIMSRPDRDRPITGLCVVSRMASCPTGYDVLCTTHDTHESCNLWPVSFFGAHTDRFLCYCRNVQHEYWSDADKILVDIMLMGGEGRATNRLHNDSIHS